MTSSELKTLVCATGCAEEHGGFVFLCDPQWGSGERAALALGLEKWKSANLRSEISEGWLCVPTGGTSGGVRFARHDEATLSVAVRGFVAHFGIQRVNAVDVLPPFHVSGLMARVRAAATGGEHLPWAWKRLEAGELPVLPRTSGGWVISLVPTQLQRLLALPRAVDWLRGFGLIFVGGGPIWPELAETAVAEKLPLSLSYGMTETAAMVAALRPAEFLAGDRSCGTALPHARIALDAEGIVRIAGDSLFHGYLSPGDAAGACHGSQDKRGRSFVTEDVGKFDERGHLHILGRRDAVIITGGKKVNPSEVETALRASGEFSDVAVIGVPDAEWGQAVVACYPAIEGRPPNLGRAVEALPGYQRPKRFVAVRDWPRNAQGKVNRAVLRATAMK